MTAQQLTVSLTYASAPIGHPAEVRLRLQLSVELRDGLPSGTGSVSQKGQGVRDFAVDIARFDQLCQFAQEAGFPDRLPKVEGKNDTSDRWAQVQLDLALDGKHQKLDLSVLSSSFEGPDAPSLRLFFKALLRVAKIADEGIRFDLTGS